MGDPHDAFVAQIQARLPGVPVIAVTQNPQKAAADYDVPHSQRRIGVVAYGSQRSSRVAVIDTYQAFLDYGDWATDLLSDNLHPNSAGSQLWADTVMAAYDGA